MEQKNPSSDTAPSQKLIIYQRPNATLIISGISLAIATITTDIIHILAVICFVMVGTIWSYDELVRGVNIIRKLFGLVGSIFIAIYLFQQLV